MKIQALKSFTTADLSLSLGVGWVAEVDNDLANQLISDGLAEEYKQLVPTGNISITENGTVNVAQYENAVVNVGIYKDISGEIYAVKPNCSHLGCLLSWNNLDKTWDCPCHGSRFDYMGRNIYEPAIKNLEKIVYKK